MAVVSGELGTGTGTTGALGALGGLQSTALGTGTGAFGSGVSSPNAIGLATGAVKSGAGAIGMDTLKSITKGGLITQGVSMATDLIMNLIMAGIQGNNQALADHEAKMFDKIQENLRNNMLRQQTQESNSKNTKENMIFDVNQVDRLDAKQDKEKQQGYQMQRQQFSDTINMINGNAQARGAFLSSLGRGQK
jgi:hypothetical protein